MMKGITSQSMMLFWMVSVAIIIGCDCNIPIKAIFPKDCNSSEIYDHSQLKCRFCSDNEEDASRLKMVRKNVFECSCPPGSFKDLSKETSDASVNCISCGPSKVTSFDGLSCASCSPSSLFDTVSKKCVCKEGVLQETREGNSITQTCVSCPGFTRVSSSSCVPCHQSFLRGNDSKCHCPADTHREEGGSCIPRSELIPEKPGLFSIHFDSRTVRSKFIADHLQAASYNCYRLSNRTACQMLGNMCVLLHYSFTDSLSFDLSNACMEYRKIMTGGSSSSINYQLWPKDAPWLYYGPDATAEIKKTNVPNHFRVNDQLKIIAFRYNALGHLVKTSLLDPKELELCRETSAAASVGFIFGTNFHQECILTPEEIWQETEKTPEETLFYDLYLLDSEGKSMYPIPILNLQLEKNGELMNLYEKPGDSLQLVRRFFFRESFSGVEDASLSNNIYPDKLSYGDNSLFSSLNGRKTILRYIQYFDLEISIRENDGSGSIYPPLLSISYGELTEEDIRANKPIKVSFKITYWMNQRFVERDVSIALAVLSSLGILYSLMRTWTWGKRATKVGVDLLILAKFFILSIGIISNVLFIVNVSCAINWFLVFKKQDVVHTLLPTPNQEYSLWTYLLFAFPLKTIQVIHDLIIMCAADVFFIDWEKPKSRQLEWPHLARIREIQSKAAVQETEKDTSEPSDSILDEARGDRTRRGSATKTTVPNKPTSSGPNVSIWRSLFVANEWLELFPNRRICLELHLFLVIFVLKVWKLEELTKYDHMNFLGAGDLRRHVPESLSCRVALGCLVYLALILVQASYVLLFHERYVRDKRKDFIDFCSVSNISVFIWVHERYGYYIHGRSPNGRAEVNMKEMNDLLLREEEDLCSKRGLLPNTDQQTFEMTLPVNMYDQYQRLRSILTALSTTRSTRLQNFLNTRSQDMEKKAPAYFLMTKFLSGFVDHTLKDFDYVVRDKTTMESILDAEFDERQDLGYFYNDTGMSFERIIFSGYETSLVLFELMLFIFVDIISGNYILAALVTYLTYRVIRGITVAAVKRTLVSKAFIDERFLI